MVARRCAESIEGCDTGAHQGSGLFGPQRVGDMREGLDRRNHVWGITAVVTDPEDIENAAIDEIAAPAWIASEPVSTVPSDADSIANFPITCIFAERLDQPGNLMSRAIADSRFRATLLLW